MFNTLYHIYCWLVYGTKLYKGIPRYILVDYKPEIPTVRKIFVIDRKTYRHYYNGSFYCSFKDCFNKNQTGEIIDLNNLYFLGSDILFDIKYYNEFLSNNSNIACSINPENIRVDDIILTNKEKSDINDILNQLYLEY